jgi:hypothetical protein
MNCWLTDKPCIDGVGAVHEPPLRELFEDRQIINYDKKS